MVKQGFLNLLPEEQKSVINAALIEFSSKDFDTASMNQIIQNAGISKGSMYHYFNNKEDLFIYVIEIVMHEKKKYLAEALTNLDKPYHELSFFEILKLQLDSSILFAREHPLYHFLGMQLLKMPESPLKVKIWGRMSREFDQYMDAMIKDAVSKGEIRGDLDADFIHRLMKFVLMNFTEIYPDLGSLQEISLPKLQREMSQLLAFLKSGLQPNK